jgi:hypothetical protein
MNADHPAAAAPRTRPARPWHRVMAPRDPHQAHRASTPLELLFDLSFVVAVSFAAIGLHHGIVEGDAARSVGSSLMAFFAIWWAWMNFTWFASAYDTDDGIYRFTLLVADRRRAGAGRRHSRRVPRPVHDRRGRVPHHAPGRGQPVDPGGDLRSGPPSHGLPLRGRHRRRAAGLDRLARRAGQRGGPDRLRRPGRRRARGPVVGRAAHHHPVPRRAHRRAVRAVYDHRAGRGADRRDRRGAGRDDRGRPRAGAAGGGRVWAGRGLRCGGCTSTRLRTRC